MRSPEPLIPGSVSAAMTLAASVCLILVAVLGGAYSLSRLL